MKIYTTHQNGAVGVGIIGVIVLLLLVGGGVYWSVSQDTSTTEESDGEAMDAMEGDEERMTMEQGDGEMTEDSSMNDNGYVGEVLAGKSSAPLLDFDQADYEKAVASGKLVTLYFYASWCPTCRLEFPKMEKAFDQLDTDEVVGFRVNFNDSETDDNEEALAREFGVAYQHTKVFVQNGERVLKSPETWDTERYLSEINARL